jgi:hypothetical protein
MPAQKYADRSELDSMGPLPVEGNALTSLTGAADSTASSSSTSIGACGGAPETTASAVAVAWGIIIITSAVGVDVGGVSASSVASSVGVAVASGVVVGVSGASVASPVGVDVGGIEVGGTDVGVFACVTSSSTLTSIWLSA